MPTNEDGIFEIKHAVPSTIWYIDEGKAVRALIRGWELRDNKPLEYITHFKNLRHEDIYTTEEACIKAAEKLREALEFYAKKKNYNDAYGQGYKSSMDDDQGKIAKQALQTED